MKQPVILITGGPAYDPRFHLESRMLNKTYAAAIEEIERKAIRMGADAVVGLKIDFNEISSKDKAMFMVSAVGTAVKLR